MEIIVERDAARDSDEIEFLERQLMRYNQEKIRGYGYKNVILKVNDDTGELTAGLHGQIGGNWLYVASLWVNSAFRGQGLGRALLTQAEQVALDNSCTGIYLYTYSFQNPGFYEGLGFEIFGTLPDFCNDQAKFYMRKFLQEENTR